MIISAPSYLSFNGFAVRSLRREATPAAGSYQVTVQRSDVFQASTTHLRLNDKVTTVSVAPATLRSDTVPGAATIGAS